MNSSNIYNRVFVNLVFFASAHELTGCRQTSLYLTTPTTAKKIFSEVISTLPQLHCVEKSIILAINQEYIEGDVDQVDLAEGDEVAFIPPISGG